MPCKVDVFALEVGRQLEHWPEKGSRDMLWLPPEEAALRVSEPGLRQLLKDFRKQLPQPKARRAAL
jgi:hypothetical protein